MANVLSSNGVPATTAFAGSTGTPLVVDTNTGNGYVLIGGVVEGINTTGNAATATNSTNASNATDATNLIAGGTIASSVTGITQANGDNTTLIATDAFVQAALTYYNTPVAWNGSTDRVLGVGKLTSDSFTSATSIPLHIACGDGQIYEIEMVGSYTAAAASASTLLLPNNTAMSGTNNLVLSANYTASATPTGSVSTLTSNGFFIGVGGSSVHSAVTKVFTSTLTKYSQSNFRSGNSTTNYAGLLISEWLDTTTVWSSIGTITMPNAWTGQIVCKRIA